MPPSLAGKSLGDFPLEQLCDETLRHTFEQVRGTDGQNLHPNVAPSYPYFFFIKDRLYQVMQVPKSCRELLFHMTRHNTMVRHLGQDKTSSWLIFIG